jgi:hypothetical protein
MRGLVDDDGAAARQQPFDQRHGDRPITGIIQSGI